MARAQPELKKITGRKAFLELLVSEGVTHLFGNPGTTELALMEVVPDFPQLTYVLGLQESIVLGMADGFARASGRLAACNLHCTPGLGHAMGALYSAHMSGSPILTEPRVCRSSRIGLAVGCTGGAGAGCAQRAIPFGSPVMHRRSWAKSGQTSGTL